MTHFLRRYLPLLLIIMVGIVLRGIAIQHTDPTNVIEQPLLDDSFYYFTLGRNMAQGKGAMVDDQHLTTGFQPLWGAMSLLPALITQDMTGMITAFQWMGVMVSAIGAVFVYLLTQRVLQGVSLGRDGIIHIMALCNVALWYWHPHHIRYSINGMETVLSTTVTLAVLTCFVWLYQRPSWRGMMVLGASFGVAFLARVDTVTLLIWLIVALAIFPPMRGGVVHRLKMLIVMGMMGALVISPWAIFSLSQGKFILPESGSAVRAHTLYTGQADQLPPPLSPSLALSGDPAFADYYGNKMGQFMGHLSEQLYALTPFMQPPNQPNAVILSDINLRVVNINLTYSVFGMLIGIFVLGGVSVASQSKLLRAMWLIACLWVITAIVMYAFVVISWWFYERYALPIAEIITILALCVLYGGLLRWIKAHGLILAIVMVMTIVLLGSNWQSAWGRYAWLGTNLPIIGNDIPNVPAPRSGFYEGAMWLNENIPSTARVGAFQSGVIVYYADATVINLDGKVNADAHRAMTDGRMWAYICEQQLDYVIDWPVMIHFLLVQRSQDWQEGNLEQIALLDGWINPMQVNRVNHDACP